MGRRKVGSRATLGSSAVAAMSRMPACRSSTSPRRRKRSRSIGEKSISCPWGGRRGTAAGWRLDGLDGVGALAVGLPAHALVGGQTGTPRRQGDVIGDDEGSVEARAELAAEHGIFALVSGRRPEEFARVRFGEGADILHDLFARHADVVVADGVGKRIKARAVRASGAAWFARSAQSYPDQSPRTRGRVASCLTASLLPCPSAAHSAPDGPPLVDQEPDWLASSRWAGPLPYLMALRPRERRRLSIGQGRL